MRYRLMVVSAILALLVPAADLLACGDKFLVAGRGTRYQRPKNARTATVLIYADPSSKIATQLDSERVQTMLKRQGHRSATARSLEQLSALISAGQVDVILAASGAVANVERVVSGVAGKAVVLGFDLVPKETMLLGAIDKAVVQRDQSLQVQR